MHRHTLPAHFWDRFGGGGQNLGRFASVRTEHRATDRRHSEHQAPRASRFPLPIQQVSAPGCGSECLFLKPCPTCRLHSGPNKCSYENSNDIVAVTARPSYMYIESYTMLRLPASPIWEGERSGEGMGGKRAGEERGAQSRPVGHVRSPSLLKVVFSFFLRLQL